MTRVENVGTDIYLRGENMHPILYFILSIDYSVKQVNRLAVDLLLAYYGITMVISIMEIWM